LGKVCLCAASFFTLCRKTVKDEDLTPFFYLLVFKDTAKEKEISYHKIWSAGRINYRPSSEEFYLTMIRCVLVYNDLLSLGWFCNSVNI
jgi:hypothetical protein